MRGAQADIHLAALTHNLRQIKALAGTRKILAMIKSDGYGHGAVRVARALTEADGFGVASLDEAVTLRHAGIFQPILIMSQFMHRYEFQYISAFDLSIVIHHEHQLSLLEQVKSQVLSKPITVWLKIDSGMHRLGFTPKQLPATWQRLQALSWIKKPISLMTHLASADVENDDTTPNQVATFEQAVAYLPGERSISNSAGLLRYPRIQQEWIRPGIVLYGVSPFMNSFGTDFNLYPVMTLRSLLIAIKSVERGDRIGYAGCWTCPEPMLLGIVEIGYGDGYPRHAKNGTPVLINGVICYVVGRVSMDLITVDLRPCPQAKVGDTVVLWGRGLPVERVAACADTIPYELLCHMGERVRFAECNE